MNFPKITVITPSFNQGTYLEETILSVLNQDYPNLEYIVIDGGSQDNSVSIITKYEKQLTSWISERDSGQADAINKGYRLATGELITWLNSDDLFAEGALVKAAEIFNASLPSVGVIHGETELFGISMQSRIDSGYDSPTIERYLSGMSFAQPSAFIQKKYWDQVGELNTNYHYGMDYDLFSKLSLVCSFKKTSTIFSKYRIHKSSKSSSQGELFIEDWIKIYANILSNFGQKGYLEELSTLHLLPDHHAEPKFSFAFQQPEVKWELSFFYFLSYLFRSDYIHSDFKRAKLIGNYLHRNFQTYLHADPKLKLIYGRLKLFPEILIPPMRAFKNILK